MLLKKLLQTVRSKITVRLKVLKSIYNTTKSSMFNPIQDGREGGGAKRPPTSFSPVTSTNIGISPQNILSFSFDPFDTLVSNFKFAPSASPKLLDLNQHHLSKKSGFSGQVLIKFRL